LSKATLAISIRKMADRAYPPFFYDGKVEIIDNGNITLYFLFDLVMGKNIIV